MGKFIARAFIKCPNNIVFSSAIESLYSIGRKVCNPTACFVDAYYTLAINPYGFEMFCQEFPFKEDYIDCNLYANGDEDLAVKLFLSLAEMDSENTDTLWYFAETLTTNKDGGDVRSDTVYFKGLSLYAKCNPTTQPLSPLAFAEAVRDGKIKL